MFGFKIQGVFFEHLSIKTSIKVKMILQAFGISKMTLEASDNFKKKSGLGPFFINFVFPKKNQLNKLNEHKLI